MSVDRSSATLDDGLGPPPARDLGALAWAVSALLGAQALGTIAISLSVFVRTFIADSEALWELENALLRPDQALFFLTGIVFLIWFYRAHTNLRPLGVAPLHSSSFAVGCWFVPIANLFYPYQIAADIWRGSVGWPHDEVAAARRERGVGIVGVWWALYVLKGLIGLLGGVLVAEVNRGAGAFEFANSVVIVANLTGLACALVAIRMVWGITQRQRETAAVAPAPLVF